MFGLIKGVFDTKFIQNFARFSLASRNFASLVQIDEKRKQALDIHLSNIRDNPGSRPKATRVGRGPGSTKGKTAGRGMKGQNKRSGGGVRLGFEGGQTPFYLRIPKQGPPNPFKKPLDSLNLDRLQYWISTGRIDPEKPITMKVLRDSACVTGFKHGVKLLARGSELFTSKINIEVTRASQEAIKAIETVGGKITTRYYDRIGLRLLLHPEKFDPLKIPKFALPSLAKERAYYNNWENRGYLASPPSTSATTTTTSTSSNSNLKTTATTTAKTVAAKVKIISK